MSRAPGVTPPIVLRDAPAQYDAADQRELRRVIEKISRQLPDYNAVNNVPASISVLNNYTVVQVTTALTPISRQTVTITTASLADLAVESSNVALPFTTGALLVISVDRSCWVRLYATDTEQTADLTRTRGTLGTPGTGLLAEFQCMSGAQTVHVSPVAIIANDEATPTKRVWYTIQNLSGSTSPVVVTLTLIQMQP